MRVVLPVERVREVEAAAMAALPAGTLMQRAATGLAGAAAALLGGCYGRRVVVVAGSGDNGGDALFAGARLARRGASVVALASGSRLHETGLAALVAAGGRRVEVADADLASADLVIDGIVGIGSRPGLSGSAAELAGDVGRVRAASGAGPRVLAVDLPSGIDPDTGETPGVHVRADLTVTFGVHKPGLLVDPGAGAAGVVELVDIGLPLPAAEPAFAAVGLADVGGWLQTPPRSADKYSRGVVGLVTGSPRYPGAGMLSVHGARCGLAGMVRFVGEEALGQAVASRFPDVVPHSPDSLGRVQAWVVGSGGGELGPIVPFERLLADEVPVLVDADGLSHLPAPEDRPEGARLLLTPHAGELARLLEVEREQVQARRLWHAREAAQRLDATVLLKGATTVVATTDGRVRVPLSPGPSWLATAGSGDVLSGLAGALLAIGLDPLSAGVAATVLHSAAARLAGPAMTSSDLAAALPQAVRQVLAG